MVDTYDPKSIIVTFGDRNINQGIVEGTFLSLTKSNDTRTFRIGSDGGATIQVNPDDSAVVEITYRYGTSGNDTLEDLREDEDATPAIYRVGTFVIEDFNGGTFVVDENAFIMGPPLTQDFGQDEPNRVWKIGLPKPRINTRGTSAPPRIGDGST